MAWKRGYYYTNDRDGGRVVSRYVGRGEVAHLAAQLDYFDREQRKADLAAAQATRAALQAEASEVETVCDEVDQIVAAALQAAGYHRHKRGEWRKARHGRHCD